MSGEIEAGRAFVSVAVKDAVDRGLNAVTAKLSGFSKTVMGIGAGLTGIGAAITAPLLAALPAYAEGGKALSLLNERTGISVGLASQLKGALGETGGSLEGLEKGFLKLNKKLVEAAGGSATAQAEFKQFGLSAQQLQSASPDERLNLIADALSRIQDPGMRSAAAMQLLGKGGAELVPILSRGAAGLQALREKAAALGEGATEGGVEKARAAADAYSDFGRVWTSIPKAAAAAIAEPMTRWMRWLTGIGVGVKKFVKDHQDLIQVAFRVASAIGAVGTVLVGFSAAQKAAAALQSPLTKMFANMGASAVAFLASPVGLATAALVGGVAAWALYTESGQSCVAKIKEAFGPMVDTVTSTVSGVKDALASGDFSLAAEIAGTGIKLAFLQAVGGLSDLLSGIMGPAGDQLKSLGSDALQGNWTAVVADLGGLWANFCGGVVRMMTEAVDKIMGLWSDAVKSISNWLLEASASGGVMGGVASAMLGVDMKDANAKNKILTMRAQENDRKTAAESIPKQQEWLRQAKESGDSEGVEKWTRAIAENQAKAAGTFQYGSQGGMDVARESIDNQVKGWKDAVTDWTSDVREEAARQAAAASDEANARAQAAREAKGTSSFEEYTGELSSRLKELNAQAAHEKDVFEKKMRGDRDLQGAGDAASPTQLKWNTPTGTTGAYALAQMFGQGGGVQEKLLDEAKTQSVLSAETLEQMKELNRRSGDGMLAWGASNIDG